MSNPELDAAQIIELENHHSSGVYAKQPIVFVRGQGAILWDMDGNAFLDCASGHGVANLGHAHPKVSAAIAEQSSRLVTLFESYYNDQRAALMSRITSLVPGLERVFFCNSGTEAVEAAIKFARLSTHRTGIIAMMRAFHGRTFGALSATFNKRYRQGVEPLVPGFSHVPFNNIGALEKAVTAETAAVLLEIVQGEGGVYIADPAFVQAARHICDERGTLLIIDEVQTGFGRTGKMFAFQHTEVNPDLLCVAKSLAGGLPMGAVLIGSAVGPLSPGMHASTFGGNPLACAAALAALQAIQEEDLPGQAAEKGSYLLNHLCQIDSPLIREVEI
jgi:acetylornithine/LysW-gamma-L-lysine aminotransferase